MFRPTDESNKHHNCSLPDNLSISEPNFVRPKNDLFLVNGEKEVDFVGEFLLFESVSLSASRPAVFVYQLIWEVDREANCKSSDLEDLKRFWQRLKIGDFSH